VVLFARQLFNLQLLFHNDHLGRDLHSPATLAFVSLHLSLSSKREKSKSRRMQIAAEEMQPVGKKEEESLFFAHCPKRGPNCVIGLP